MTIAIAGKNEIACRFVEYLRSDSRYSKHQLLVVTNSTDSGRHSWQRSLKLVADQLGVSVVREEELYELNDLVFISLEYDRIIRPERFATRALFNIHFSLLPAYKGMYTSILPILYGEKHTGVTLHKIDRGIDTGDIIDQTRINLSRVLTSEDLYSLYSEKGYELIVNNIDSLINSSFSTIQQQYLGSSYYSKASIDFKNILISPLQTAFQLTEFVRAFCFRPYQRPKWNDIDIDLAYVLDKSSTVKPGTILREDEYQIDISTIDYDVKLIKAKDEELLEYARTGKMNELQRYRELGGRITAKNDLGWDVAIVAAYNGQYDILIWALFNGISKTTTNYNGTTIPMYLLSYGERTGDFSLMSRFIKYEDVDLKVKDYFGFTIMDYALERGNSQGINTLKEFYL